MTDVFARACQQMPERELQQHLELLMHQLCQPYFHDNFSRQNNGGLPDLLVPIPPTLWVLELKSAAGRVTAAQSQWLSVLQRCTHIETQVLRPTDYEEFRDEFLIPSWQSRQERGFTDDVSLLAAAIDHQKRGQVRRGR